MNHSLFNNAMISIGLSVSLIVLFFIANHFIKEKRVVTISIVILALLTMTIGLRNLYYANNPSLITTIATYEGVHQFGEAFGSTWYFVSEREEELALTLDYFSMREVIPSGELEKGVPYTIKYDEKTDVLVEVSEITHH